LVFWFCGMSWLNSECDRVWLLLSMMLMSMVSVMNSRNWCLGMKNVRMIMFIYMFRFDRMMWCELYVLVRWLKSNVFLNVMSCMSRMVVMSWFLFSFSFLDL